VHRQGGRPAQAVLDGMPRRLYPCTPTRLATWLDCPRRYRMAYLDRPAPPKGPPWAHNSFGASVHNALAGWWRLPLARRTVAAAGGLLADGWIDEGYTGPAQSQRHRGRARDMVERYTATLDPHAEPRGVERTVGTHTERIVVSGRVDRLDARRGPGGDTELVVVDYKTGRRPLSADDARTSQALALYALAAARIFHAPCHRVELHHLPTGEVHGWEHSDATVARHVRRAEQIAAECEQADGLFAGGLPETEVDQAFPPRPGPACSWCDFRAHCPEGSAAAPAHRPWDGLPQNDD
jgi:PD-(D/E)XK nuclease superfamily